MAQRDGAHSLHVGTPDLIPGTTWCLPSTTRNNPEHHLEGFAIELLIVLEILCSFKSGLFILARIIIWLIIR